MVKRPACDVGDLGSIPDLGRSPADRNGNLLQYSGLENSMDRGAWQATVHGVTKIWTRLRGQWHPPPVLLPRGSHGWRSLAGCSPWDHEESDTTERLQFHFSLSCTGEGNGNPLVFLPGQSQGRGSLVGCRLWGCTELDTTEAT